MPEGEWASCTSVTLRDGVLHCLLEPKKTYVLAEAYEDNLHVRLANANSDKELADFIRGWGPLWIPMSQIPVNGVILLPLALCRAYQRHIKALLGALTAFKWAEGEWEALGELISTEHEELLDIFAAVFHITGNVMDWAKRANLGEVRAATSYLVKSAITSQFSLQFALRRKGYRHQVEAGWRFLNLLDALLWMIWYDEFTKHPVVCCPECRKVFRGETARARKYCSVECGHRATAREAMQRKRAAERAEGK